MVMAWRPLMAVLGYYCTGKGIGVGSCSVIIGGIGKDSTALVWVVASEIVLASVAGLQDSFVVCFVVC